MAAAAAAALPARNVERDRDCTGLLQRLCGRSADKQKPSRAARVSVT
jgi:hypothetical protein